MLSTLTLTYGDRLPYLQKCINSIRRTVPQPREIIVINNGSEPIKEWLAEQRDIKFINLENNEGVCARNYGLDIATPGNLIAQIDDDVVVLDGWLDKVLPYFKDLTIGGVGVQGAYWDGWLNYDQSNIRTGDYVDFLTGFFWVYRNVPDVRFDWNLGKFWTEESEFQLQMKSKGFRFKVCPWVVSHDCQRRDPVDWKQHDFSKDYATNKWKGKEELLNFEKQRKGA